MVSRPLLEFVLRLRHLLTEIKLFSKMQEMGVTVVAKVGKVISKYDEVASYLLILNEKIKLEGED
jgi:hypothetical protein